MHSNFKNKMKEISFLFNVQSVYIQKFQIQNNYQNNAIENFFQYFENFFIFGNFV